MASPSQQQLIDKATRDAAFRQQLMNDPRAAIQQELGTAVPDGVEIVVVEESPTQVYLVLPTASESGLELSDSDLERVAGGDPTIPWPTGSC